MGIHGAYCFVFGFGLLNSVMQAPQRNNSHSEISFRPFNDARIQIFRFVCDTKPRVCMINFFF